MKDRIIKMCECGYRLTETVKEYAVETVKGKCTCPQCGGEATHLMHIDKRNLPDGE
jgi:hypothetical protein